MASDRRNSKVTLFSICEISEAASLNPIDHMTNNLANETIVVNVD